MIYFHTTCCIQFLTYTGNNVALCMVGLTNLVFDLKNFVHIMANLENPLYLIPGSMKFGSVKWPEYSSLWFI